MKRFLAWLDERTGLCAFAREVLYHSVPGEASWRHVWGNVILFALLVEFITGFFLWLGYSPGTRTAWASVFYLQQMPGGSLLRGIHHFMADALVVLLALHLLQMILLGTYRAPREWNYWIALSLLLLVSAVALTGYLLPWDQHGYWGTKIRAGYLALIPIVGPSLQKLVLGGAELGHLTLTRFFALHAGALPVLIVIFIVLQGFVLRKQARASGEAGGSLTRWFPEQAFREAITALAVLGIVLVLAHRVDLTGAPANPGESFAAARPEWYFYFFYQLLAYFGGSTEVIGAVVLPCAVLLGLFALPLIAKWRRGHHLNLAWVSVLLVSSVVLTLVRVNIDRKDVAYLRARDAERREGQRVVELASGKGGIPLAGAEALLEDDPWTRGPRLFAAHCASCHRYGGENGLGVIPSDPQSASDLKGFGSRAWLTGLLDPARIATTNYFGATEFREGKMVKYVRNKVSKYSEQKQIALRKVIAAVSAEARLKSQASLDAADADVIAEGRQLIVDEIGCIDCHQFREPDDLATAPDLTGYGSRDWLIAFLWSPAHPRFYGDRNDRMPAFGMEGQLDERSLGLIADWLRGDWYVPASSQ